MRESNGAPKQYKYFQLLKEHLKGDLDKIFGDKLVLPRQLEIHLPGDHKKACNFNCSFCEGRILSQELCSYEEKALSLIKDINGQIPYIIFGGLYSEPLLNPYLLEMIKETKRTGANFGLHTNGALLKELEDKQGFISQLCELSNSNNDYISISIDAGSPESHKKVKGTKQNYFSRIIEGLRILAQKRSNGFPALRMSYLICEENSSYEDIKNIVSIAKELGIDSLKFSIPYECFGSDFSKVREYKNRVEKDKGLQYETLIAPFLSKDNKEKPYIFYMSPVNQDVDKMNFQHCAYSYYQITIGTDGFVYRCSSTASPSFRMNRLGFIPENFDGLKELVKKNQDITFNPKSCFKMGARCDRVSLAINTSWEEIRKRNKKTL
jgi:MoaA/NifB/PqqE/SkfB family radical SAM enzyme